jgi:hypothetical protein
VAAAFANLGCHALIVFPSSSSFVSANIYTILYWLLVHKHSWNLSTALTVEDANIKYSDPITVIQWNDAHDLISIIARANLARMPAGRASCRRRHASSRGAPCNPRSGHDTSSTAATTMAGTTTSSPRGDRTTYIWALRLSASARGFFLQQRFFFF